MQFPKLQHLAESRGTKFDVFVQEPYGSGWSDDRVIKGEVLPDFDAGGAEFEFVGVTDDGKQLIMMKDGKERKMSPARFSALILPKGQKPRKEVDEGEIKDSDPKRAALLASFKKGNIKALIIAAKPGTGNIASIKAAVPGIVRFELDSGVTPEVLAKFVQKHAGKSILVDLITRKEKLSPELIALLKGMLSGSISYRTADINIKADLNGTIIAVDVNKLAELPAPLKDRAVVYTVSFTTNEATQAVTSTARTYKMKKYAGAGFGMWRDDAKADGFKVKLVSGSEDTDDQVWDAFDGIRKVGSFSDEDRRGWLQAKL